MYVLDMKEQEYLAGQWRLLTRIVLTKFLYNKLDFCLNLLTRADSIWLSDCQDSNVKMSSRISPKNRKQRGDVTFHAHDIWGWGGQRPGGAAAGRGGRGGRLVWAAGGCLHYLRPSIPKRFEPRLLPFPHGSFSQPSSWSNYWKSILKNFQILKNYSTFNLNFQLLEKVKVK